MTPGKTYVGILPGHTRPAFVRKRPVDAGRPPLLLTQIFGSSRRAYSVEAPRKPSMFCRPRRDSYHDYAAARYPPKFYIDQSPGRVITSVQQTCASCGKFRSARWQARHPLIPGTASRPGLCGSCRDKHTSSEEERPRHRWRRRRHRHRDYTESTDDSYDTSWESRRAARRRRSYSRDHMRRSLARSPSRENVRIIIANQAGGRIRPEREMTRSSSVEPVRVTRHTEVVDLPERPLRHRSTLRSSSHAHYVDSATQYIEDLDPPRCLSRPRAVSRMSCIEDVRRPRYYSRPRSSSHVSYVEELDRPRYRSRPRSVSRVSYIEDLDRPRSRRRARSSSQVRFVGETVEPVSLSRKRRRVMYCDGVADSDESEQQAYHHAPSNHGSSQGAAIGDGDAALTEENLAPHIRASQKTMNQDGAVELVEGHTIPHRCPSSQFHKVTGQTPSPVSDHHYRQPSETRSHASESDHDATPRPVFCHPQVIRGPDDVEEPPSHHSSYIDFEGPRFDRGSYSPALESGESGRQRTFTGIESPDKERRERVRESDESSSPDDDDYPRQSPMSYRHVEAPEPPAPRSDLLVEMLQNASITPPRAQYARGRPSRRNHHRDLDTSSQSYPRRASSSEDSEDGPTGYGDRRMVGETRCSGPSPRGPEFRSNAEYDWMT